jgi:hypothetical protein
LLFDERTIAVAHADSQNASEEIQILVSIGVPNELILKRVEVDELALILDSLSVMCSKSCVCGESYIVCCLTDRGNSSARGRKQHLRRKEEK